MFGLHVTWPTKSHRGINFLEFGFTVIIIYLTLTHNLQFLFFFLQDLDVRGEKERKSKAHRRGTEERSVQLTLKQAFDLSNFERSP